MVTNMNKKFLNKINESTDVGKLIYDMKQIKEKLKQVPNSDQIEELQKQKVDTDDFIDIQT